MTSLIFSEGSEIPEPYMHRKQLLNHIVDGLAKARPSTVWAEIPKSSTTYAAGFREITYRTLSNAVNSIAWWLHDSLGSGEDFKTLAYFGPWDARYVILLLGAVKAGYKMVFPSPKYSLAGLENLLEKLHCTTFLTASDRPPVVSAFLQAHDATVLNVPSMELLLEATPPHYPYDKTFSTARKEPLVALHTSGSTSHPKAIIWTHDYAASFLQQQQVMPPPEYESVNKFYHGNRMMPLLPPFHAGNLFGSLLVAIGNQSTVVYPLPDATLKVETLIDVLRHSDVDVAISSPMVLEQLALDSSMRRLVSEKLKALGYAGGDISQAAGDKLAQDTTFFSSYASTENGITPAIRPARKLAVNEWKRLEPHPKSDTEFRHLGNNEYEAVIVRNPDEEEEQPVFKVFPHLTEWSTKDIFTPDPMDPGSWIYRSRVDDLVVFSDGTSFNPLQFEQQISGHPEIEAALMFGTRRSQAALLIELSSPQVFSDSTYSETIERLWPFIAETNNLCTAQSTISKSHIVLTSPERPMPRAGKGTVQRARAIKLYESELASLYT